MSKPLLNKSRYNNLLTLVMPPICEVKWIDIADKQFRLTDMQKKGLENAKKLVERYLTNTMTNEDKALLSRQGRESFETVNEVTNYKWY